MNALSGDTPMFVEVDDKYGVYTLRELFELHKQGRAIKVPALLDEYGNIGWVEVEDVVSFGKQRLKRITLATTRLYVEISEGTIIPAYSCELFRGKEEKRIKLKIKYVNNLKVARDPEYNDTFLLAKQIPLRLPEGNQEEWEIGFALGYFIAEGSLVYRKRKNTKQSLAKLNGFAKQKGMSLDEYLEYMTDIGLVRLSIGQLDFERGYAGIVKKHFKFATPYKRKNENAYDLVSSDLSLIHLIKDHINGSDSHTKHLKNEAYNHSWMFLKGILDGFLAGDGSYYKKGDLFRVGITTNYNLYNDLIFLSKGLGYDVHLWKAKYESGGFANGKFYYHLYLSIFKNYHRHTALGLVKEHIKSIEDISENAAFNLILKPLYPENDARSAFNHLFIVAYGILVSDAVKTFTKLH